MTSPAREAACSPARWATAAQIVPALWQQACYGAVRTAQRDYPYLNPCTTFQAKMPPHRKAGKSTQSSVYCHMYLKKTQMLPRMKHPGRNSEVLAANAVRTCLASGSLQKVTDTNCTWYCPPLKGFTNIVFIISLSDNLSLKRLKRHRQKIFITARHLDSKAPSLKTLKMVSEGKQCQSQPSARLLWREVFYI